MGLRSCNDRRVQLQPVKCTLSNVEHLPQLAFNVMAHSVQADDEHGKRQRRRHGNLPAHGADDNDAQNRGGKRPDGQQNDGQQVVPLALIVGQKQGAHGDNPAEADDGDHIEHPARHEQHVDEDEQNAAFPQELCKLADAVVFNHVRRDDHRPDHVKRPHHNQAPRLSAHGQVDDPANQRREQERPRQILDQPGALELSLGRRGVRYLNLHTARSLPPGAQRRPAQGARTAPPRRRGRACFSQS